MTQGTRGNLLFALWGICLLACFLLTGCSLWTMTEEEYVKEFKPLSERHINEMLAKIEDREQDRKRFEDIQNGMNEEITGLEEEIEKLKTERKKINEAFINVMAGAREGMARVKSQIDELQDVFFDIRIGKLPRNGLANRWNDRGESDWTLLVDMEKEIEVDRGQISGLEVFSSEGVRPGVLNELYVVVLRREGGNNKYVLADMSKALYIYKKGKNVFRFFDMSLEVEKGNRVGLLLGPKTSIDYDDIDLGNVHVRHLADMNGVFHEQYCSNNNKKRFAFSILGTSPQTYVALVKKASPAPETRTLHHIDVAYGFDAANFTETLDANRTDDKKENTARAVEQVSIPFYVAIFHKRENEDKQHDGEYVMIGLSERLSLTISSAMCIYQRFEPVIHFRTSSATISKGDYCALVFSPGNQSKGFHFREIYKDKKRVDAYIKFEDLFNPTNPWMTFPESRIRDDSSSGGFSPDKQLGNNIHFIIDWE